MVAENSNDRKLQGTEFHFMNLAADICLPKMVAGLLSHPKRHSFILPKIIGIHLRFITKLLGDTLLTKMPAELPSTEQIYTETSRLVPLKSQGRNQHRRGTREIK